MPETIGGDDGYASQERKGFSYYYDEYYYYQCIGGRGAGGECFESE